MDLDFVFKNFECDFETGDLFRIRKGGQRAKSGTKCNGYMRSGVNGVLTYNHRIVWALYYRELPPEFIDHIDRDRTNDSIINLRGCSLSENQMNRKISSNNTTGFTGVTYIKSKKKFKATIYVDSVPVYLGLFKTAEDASNAYLKAKESRVSSLKNSNNTESAETPIKGA